MKKMWNMVRNLVRTGALKPAYARQIMQIHTDGHPISNGFQLWYGNGWKYDPVIFGCGDVIQTNDILANPHRIRHKGCLRKEML